MQPSLSHDKWSSLEKLVHSHSRSVISLYKIKNATKLQKPFHQDTFIQTHEIYVIRLIFVGKAMLFFQSYQKRIPYKSESHEARAVKCAQNSSLFTC